MKCSHCPWVSSDKREFFNIKVGNKMYPLCSECYMEFTDCMGSRKREQQFLYEIEALAKMRNERNG